MIVDIRQVIGAMFTLIGGILALYGAFGSAGSAGELAIDVEWGAVMVAFGAALLYLTRRSRRQARTGA